MSSSEDKRGWLVRGGAVMAVIGPFVMALLSPLLLLAADLVATIFSPHGSLSGTLSDWIDSPLAAHAIIMAAFGSAYIPFAIAGALLDRGAAAMYAGGALVQFGLLLYSVIRWAGDGQAALGLLFVLPVILGVFNILWALAVGFAGRRKGG